VPPIGVRFVETLGLHDNPSDLNDAARVKVLDLQRRVA